MICTCTWFLDPCKFNLCVSGRLSYISTCKILKCILELDLASTSLLLVSLIISFAHILASNLQHNLTDLKLAYIFEIDHEELDGGKVKNLKLDIGCKSLAIYIHLSFPLRTMQRRAIANTSLPSKASMSRRSL